MLTMLTVILVLVLVSVVLAAYNLAVMRERESQRIERHLLKNELAAAKLILKQHGIEFPDSG